MDVAPFDCSEKWCAENNLCGVAEQFATQRYTCTRRKTIFRMDLVVLTYMRSLAKLLFSQFFWDKLFPGVLVSMMMSNELWHFEI